MVVKTVEKDDYFKIDVEAHLWPDISDIKYFPGMRWESTAFTGIARIRGVLSERVSETGGTGDKVKFPPSNDPERLIEAMDKYGEE